jgi:SAM-dependent methyltransferase
MKLSGIPRQHLRALRDSARNVLSKVGYDNRDWARIVLFAECDRFIRTTFSLDTAKVLAISSGGHFGEIGFKDFTITRYPPFDICTDRLDDRFDLIIADQVFEHLKYPYKAGRNVYEMLLPGGWFIVATPFLIKLHPSPIDCCRWTLDGLKYFLMECGFLESNIRASSWGNRAYIRRQLRWPGWPRRGFWGSLKNEETFPVVVWAFAQK